MNADFVCIKVDREERPDLDAVYMNATVALTGQGGWPMTCFLTPDGRPFFCGTYYPKRQFLQLLSAVVETWRDRARRGGAGLRPDRRRTAHDGGRAARAGARLRRPSCATMRWPPCCATRTPRAAGSVAAPKFPPSALLEALLRNHERTGVGATRWPPSSAPARRWPAAASTTSWPAASPATASTTPGWCRISRRCSTTTRCCCACTRTGRGRTGSALAHRVAEETADFLCDDLGRRRPVHLVAGRRRRRPRGLHLRVDASTTARRARRRRRAVGGERLFGVTDDRHLRDTAPRCCNCRSTPTDADGWSGSGPHCWRRAAVRVQPGPRRQGRDRMERAGDHRAGRGVGGTGPAGIAQRRPHAARAALLTSHLVGGRLRRASLGGVVGDSAADPRGLRRAGDGVDHALSAHR